MSSELLAGCTHLHQDRASPVVAPSVNNGIIRIPVWISFVMFRRAGSVLVKLLVGIYWITLFSHFCFRMQTFKEQQFDQSILVGIDIR